MFKELANLGNVMRQAQQMTGQMQEMNDRLKTKRATGVAGGGMVEVEVNGLGEVLRLTIDPKLVEDREKDMIEDLVPAAINDAVRKSKQLHVEEMKDLTSGIPLPGLDEAISKFSGIDTTE